MLVDIGLKFYSVPSQPTWMTLRSRSQSLIGLAVSEKKMFEYYDHIHVYSPGPGADNPWGQNIFININLLSTCILPASIPI